MDHRHLTKSIRHSYRMAELKLIHRINLCMHSEDVWMLDARRLMWLRALVAALLLVWVMVGTAAQWNPFICTSATSITTTTTTFITTGTFVEYLHAIKSHSKSIHFLVHLASQLTFISQWLCAMSHVLGAWISLNCWLLWKKNKTTHFSWPLPHWWRKNW